MRATLKPHPDTPAPAGARIEAEALRPTPGSLQLRYRLIMNGPAVRMPPPAAFERADDLWRHTCFEAFIRGDGQAYCEINLSPSGQWATYWFDDYRQGMRAAACEPSALDAAAPDGSFDLTAEIDLRRLPAPFDGPLSLGLSAVIEDESGGKTYWALAHAPGKPDFHHPDAFALDLPFVEPA